MRLAVVAVWLLIALALATPASAQVDTEIQANYARAVAYWGQDVSDHCPSGPSAIHDQGQIATYDQSLGGSMHAVALTYLNTCTWWYGDDYLNLPAGKRCAVVAHEYGHLLGRLDGPNAPGDTAGIMAGPSLTPQCQKAADVENVRAWAAYDRRWDVRNSRRNHRDRCLSRTLRLRHAARMRARSGCRARYAVPPYLPVPESDRP